MGAGAIEGGSAVSKSPARDSEKLGRPRHFDDDTERRLVMDAAVRVMASNGFADMSVADILAEAELSTTSFYRHFQSKHALLAAIIQRDGESARAALERAIAAAPDPVAAIEAWLDGLLAQFFEPRKASRTALFTTSEVHSAYQVSDIMEMRWLLSQPLVKVLRAGHRAGVLVSPKPEPDAVSMFAVVSSAATSPHGHRSRKAARAQALRFIWPALSITDAAVSPGSRSQRSRKPRQQHTA
ncbi:TetR/AcrR family transcriptional regulator [Mycobacterium intracellulare]|uniref:TetR/AcrR family transcriptional regulator n=1 Tax=Mycobacterium intracellulare TaxID=1767 RepID=A0AAE4RA67_MYCIT|nr:TetR/AcrR family transcriptional regulator [Mycobacterium intracellulare]MDV6977044.1 TetR/AcrR family transcriptional regulator [Mycobacterium intracellulare]MDV6982341.1 TetR/AcrR family transcriptional regulator [Mycobacterium intracellulare]MDV7011875.1 TetR/AcrR family transcriptional regulator [Mycobacterium intracellulare]MDV7026811.1 TetR/AcrR family transcriptional regulator [Mycobacterium intracellulare]